MEKVSQSNSYIKDDNMSTADNIINKICNYSASLLDDARDKIYQIGGLSSGQFNTRASLVQYTCIIYKYYYEAAILEVNKDTCDKIGSLMLEIAKNAVESALDPAWKDNEVTANLVMSMIKIERSFKDILELDGHSYTAPDIVISI